MVKRVLTLAVPYWYMQLNIIDLYSLWYTPETSPIVHRRSIVQARFSLSPQRTNANSVSQNWCSPLPPEKSIPYLHTLGLLETSYTIFSVNLDEALGFRRCGQLNKAYQALSIAPTLCRRHGGQVQVLLRAMLSHAKHFRTTPSINPLDPQNFRLPKSRRAANFNSLCGRIVLSRRSQFLHKLSTLLDLVEGLEKMFLEAVSDLKDSSSLEPEREWGTLDTVHYDMNSCLRESVVILKCFFHALPDEQLSEFTAALERQPSRAGSGFFLPKRHLAHRRMALLKGQ